MVSDQESNKKEAALAAIREVSDGMIVGLGTGSTADYATRALGEKQLNITAIATSGTTEKLARSLAIELIPLAEVDTIDVIIDGADECMSCGHMIKGGGGALFREKLVASIAKRRLYVVDETKVVERLGHFPLPVEVNSFGWEIVLRNLQNMGFSAKLRREGGDIFVTDNGNYILDCSGQEIENPEKLAEELIQIVGVVEHGLFINVATEIFAAGKEGLRHWTFENS